MADNVAITAGSGTVIAADDVDGVLFQRFKPAFGADGAATDVSASNGLPVAVTAPTTVGSARTTVASPNSLTQMASHPCSSVTVRSPASNIGTVYVGGSNLNTNDGYELAPSETVSLDVANTNAIYVMVSLTNTVVQLLWVT